MAFSYHNYPGDNSTTTFNIPFTYTDTSELSVTVDGVAETGLTFPSTSTVTLTSAPASGTLVQVRRTTTLTSRAVDFASGSVLTEEDLDNSNIQVFHAAQEAVDTAGDAITLDATDRWDAGGKVIKNVGSPVANTDAVNKAFISTNLPNINTVAGISTEVTTVAGIASDVTAVVADQADIGTVATSITNVDLVGTNITSVNTNATNITDIQNASANATTATTQAGLASGFADEAEAWAQKIDGEAVTNEGYSSKAWATGGQGVTDTAGSGAAQEWATKASNSTVDGTELSSKAYAVGNMNRGSAGAHSAKDWSSYYVDGTETVDGTHKSARAYAIEAANSVATFDEKYYGVYSSDAAAENAHEANGHTVAVGDLYFNSTTNSLKYCTALQVSPATEGTWLVVQATDTSSFASTSFSLAMAIAL